MNNKKINKSSNQENNINLKSTNNLALKLLLLVSFLEGAAVMVIELLGAKIIAPFYGTSLYVWSSVLGVTLFSLATGYYSGGVISQKSKKEEHLFIIIGLGAIFTLLAPTIAPLVMRATADLGVRLGSLVSVLFYLTPPLICMGMVSPIIIQILNNQKTDAGKTAGLVFAISTVGGILATFIAGFYLIPELGIKLTALLTASVLVGVAIIGLLNKRKILFSALFVLTILVLTTSGQKKKLATSDTKIQYQSSGILGEWTVLDRNRILPNGNTVTMRILMLNGVEQTRTKLGFEPYSIWSYPHKIAALAGIKPIGSKALLLGFGGGSIAYNLNKLGFEIDAIELDSRIKYISEKFFGMSNKKCNLIFDDARHYLNTCQKKYDLVIIDLLSGEVQPSHVFTKEGFYSLKKVLKSDALIVINFQGKSDITELKTSLAPRSIYNTILAAGYNVQYCEKASDGKQELTGDMIIYGTPGNFDYINAIKKKLRYNNIDSVEIFTSKDFIPSKPMYIKDALVLVDDKPQLELLNAPTILEWRSGRLEATEELFLKRGLPLYH